MKIVTTFDDHAQFVTTDGAQDLAQEKGEPSQQASEVITCGGDDGVDGIDVPLSEQTHAETKGKAAAV